MEYLPSKGIERQPKPPKEVSLIYTYPKIRVTAPFTMDGQTRVKVVKDLVPTPKGIKLFLVCSRRNTYSATI